MKIFCYQMNPIVGDIENNTKKIINSLQKAKEKKADIFIAPELCICGYPPEDLLFFDDFINEIEKSLLLIAKETQNIFAVIGCVRKTDIGRGLFNSAAVMLNGEILGFKDKTLLPEYDVFNEMRYFESGAQQKIFLYKEKKIGIFVCEDLWQHAKVLSLEYAIDPVEDMKKLFPDIILTIAASPYYLRKRSLRYEIHKKAAISLKVPFILCNQVGANDQLVFDGSSFLLNEKGQMLKVAKSFEEDEILFDTEEKKVLAFEEEKEEKELLEALILGVKDYFLKQNFKKACVGVSGGIDSALTLYIAIKALGCENVLAIRMPSRFSSLESMEDSEILIQNLGVEILDVPIDFIFQNFLDLLSPVFYKEPVGTAEENIQARIRGIILMGISNKLNYVVLSTGNKSEMAMGYATLYGDMCGGLGVLGDVSKTLVYKISNWINREKEIIPKSIIEKEPSAELKENQTDKECLPDYEIVDLVLEKYVENHMEIEEIIKTYKIDENIVRDLVKKIHVAEFKRRQGPISISVTKKPFSKARIFPVVQKWK